MHLISRNFRYIQVILLPALLTACNPTLIPLQGNYSNKPVTLVSSTNTATTWQNIHQLFDEKGLSLKQTDEKQQGLSTIKTAFIEAYSVENELGKPEKPDAWVIIPRTTNKGKPWTPKTITSTWEIAVTENPDHITLVRINPTVVCTYHPNAFTSVETHAQSTGLLEALLEKRLK